MPPLVSKKEHIIIVKLIKLFNILIIDKLIH